MTSLPLFSVIIPTYHRNELLAKCLGCLTSKEQTLPAEQYEVIVTDDGSCTTAEEMIRQHYPWAKWVAGPRKGPAANRNNGTKYARGTWLVFTDDDCLPDSHWLEAYAQAIKDQPTCLVFEGRTYADRPKRSIAETSPLNESGGYLWSCNFGIQKQLFEMLDGFDERFPYAAMEDVELRLRLTKSGYDFLFIKLASVCHPWKPKGGWKQLEQHQISTLIYLSLHPEESQQINCQHYLRLALYGLIKSTLPNLLKSSLKEVKTAFLEHWAYLKMALILAFKTV